MSIDRLNNKTILVIIETARKERIMTIETEKTDKSTVLLKLTGRLDTAGAPLLERKIKQWGDDIEVIILDFNSLEYISSIGIRILLQTYKSMKERKGKLVIKNINDAVREVFEITGLLNLMVNEEKFIVVRKNESCNIILSLNGILETENIALISKELQSEANQTEKSTIVLDFEKLTFVSASTLHHLKIAIEESKWEGRNLKIKNIPIDYIELFKDEDLTES